MLQPFSAFVGIALLRLPPYRLPASTPLLAVTLLAHWLVGWYLLLPVERDAPAVTAPAGAAAVSTLVLLAVVHGSLAVRRLSSRTVQATSALAGAEVVIAAAVLLLRLLAEAGAGAALLILLYLAVLIWNWGVASHVLRHAHELSKPAGVLAGGLYMWVSYLVAQMALGPVN